MKTKMFVGLLMVMVLLATSACSTALGMNHITETSINVPIDEFTNVKYITKEIEIPLGGMLIVTLGSNPTTGFSWTEISHITNQAILEQTDSKSVLPEGKAIGASGSQVWTFKALNEGTTAVKMEYSRSWTGGEKAEWTFELAVTVQ